MNPERNMTIETNIAIVRRYYEEGVNQKKFGVLDEILAPGFVGFKVEGGRGLLRQMDGGGKVLTGRPKVPFGRGEASGKTSGPYARVKEDPSRARGFFVFTHFTALVLPTCNLAA